MTIPTQVILEAEEELHAIAVLNSEAFRRGYEQGYKDGREYANACDFPDNGAGS